MIRDVKLTKVVHFVSRRVARREGGGRGVKIAKLSIFSFPEWGGVYDRQKKVRKSAIYKQDFLRARPAEIFPILPGSSPDPPEKSIFGERLERNGHFGAEKVHF